MNLNIDTEVLRSYLLGTLEAEPRAELEERILSDPAVYEELLLLEEELIDQYVADRMRAREQHLSEMANVRSFEPRERAIRAKMTQIAKTTTPIRIPPRTTG